MASDHFSCKIGLQTVAEVESELPISDEHGADLRFHGVVRKGEDGRTISAIRYSHYEAMAKPELERIGAAMLEAYPGHRAFVYHRVGEVKIGVASILIRVQTAHSAPAYEISQEYLRRIKTSVPIWKEPLFVD
ncbi:MAG: molybdenum cofactor biosynthesis protein MoaE [Verrucomicrobiota bacterium]